MNGWLTSTDAAKLLGVHPATLANWRVWKRGPKYTRKGRRVWYERSELLKWRGKECRA